MLDQALVAIENHLTYLNQLDSATGDGDHGTAILAAMKAADKSARQNGSPSETLAETLDRIGWDVMSSTSGSTSALNGSFFSGMGMAAGNSEELDVDQTIAMFETGLANVRTATKAQVGDKTLMDALIPAIDAMSRKKGTGAALTDVFSAAAEAAQTGADSTKELVAKHGRARNLGERSAGHLDAGAVSLAMIYAAYAKTIAEN